MGNPQPKVSEQEYGWVAGFFDGEGTVALAIRAKAGKNQSPKIQPLAMVSGTEPVGLNELTRILDMAGLAYHVTWYQPKGYMRNGNAYKQAWSMVIAGHKRCRRFYRWLTPALRLKRDRAEVMLDYLAARESHSDFRTPISEQELQLALRLRQLNLKGKAQPYSQVLRLNAERPGASREQLSAKGRKGAEARWGLPKLGSTTTRQAPGRGEDIVCSHGKP